MKSVYRERFANTRHAAALARRAVISRLSDYGYAEQELADIETAVGEALANAAEHGHRDDSVFEVRVAIEDVRLVIEVQDDGSGFPPNAGNDVRSPDYDSPRGFGIYLMRHLMDEVEYTERGTCVRLTKRLPLAQHDANCG